MQGTRSGPASKLNTSVNRLMASGMSRYEALETIHRAVNDAVISLAFACVDGTQQLVQLAAVARLEMAVEDDRPERDEGDGLVRE